MTISLIVAISKNRAIGMDNQIPWYLPADLKYFKRTTLGHHILMGRKSYLSIGKPLPKRTNLVLTRNPFFTANGIKVIHSIEEGIALARAAGDDELFIIGGGEIYRQSMDLVDRLYITEVDIETEGDTFFPHIDKTQWKLSSKEAHEADDRNKWNYCFKVYDRTSK
ncbi:MAG: type 3 dihydrofolate reductase [Saprospirales bacterium]|nr:MAG: type 3 dihydrofolate reductase [Saprospirales bacterium]